MAYLGNSPLNRLYSTQAITLGQGQTAVNVNYAPGLTLFFKNGALLEPGADYIAADGSVLTLASPASAGDVIQGVSLAQFAAANALPLSGGTVGGLLTGPASATETIGGLIEIATTAEAQALTDDARALTPKKLADAFKGANQLLSANGYQKIPGGLIIQWANVDMANISTRSFLMPIAFPTAALAAFATDSSATPASVKKFSVATFTATNLELACEDTLGGGVRYLALGY